jgi:hypothetical protein
MPTITVISWTGEERQVDSEIGKTLMQVVRDDSVLISTRNLPGISVEN